MSRSLWPREHGAYAQLATPLATALALRTPTTPAILLAIAAGAAFLANEPLLVVLGHRGARLRESAGAAARRRLLITASIAVASGAVGIVLAAATARFVAALALVPALAVVALAWTRTEHSLPGELVAIIALPGAAAPVAVSSGVPAHAALVLWAAWSAGYACTVIAVHRVIARHRKPGSWIDPVAALVIAGVIVASVVLRTWVAVPLSAISIALIVHPPPAKRLRAIGVALVVASVVAAAVVLAQASREPVAAAHAMRDQASRRARIACTICSHSAAGSCDNAGNTTFSSSSR